MSSSHIAYFERLVDAFSIGGSSVQWTVSLYASLVVLALSLYYSRGNSKNKDAMKRLPGPKVNGIITNVVPLLSIFRNKAASNRVLFLQVVCGYSHVFRKEGMWLFYGGIKKVLMLYKAETVEPVLSSNEILSKGFEYEFLTPMLKEGLLTSKRNKWRHRRRLLTPAFHFRTLDDYVPVFSEQARVLADKIDDAMTSQSIVNVAPLTSLCTLDIICETAMGFKIYAQENNSSPYVLALHNFCKAATDRILSPWLWPDFIYYRTSEGKKFKKCLQVMDEFTRNVIAERKAEKANQSHDFNANNGGECGQEVDIGRRGKRRLALLDLLLDVHMTDPTFTLEDVAEEVDNFMFAGHDTTSSGLSFALFMLGLHPEAQLKAQQEVDDILGEDHLAEITLDHIKQLKYLDCVLKESRRLWPPTPFIARDLEEDTYINGYLVPKGTSCGILIYMLHRDPEVFPDPERFDPDRFLIENSAGRHPFAYVPFSAGPRNCIGQRFATFEALTVLAAILQRFDLKSEEPLDRVHLVDDLVLRAENGLRMSFKSRRNTTA